MRENWQNTSGFLSLNHQIVFLKGYVKLSNHIIHFLKIKINPIFIAFFWISCISQQDLKSSLLLTYLTVQSQFGHGLISMVGQEHHQPGGR